jgi:hypothetical protein
VQSVTGCQWCAQAVAVLHCLSLQQWQTPCCLCQSCCVVELLHRLCHYWSALQREDVTACQGCLEGTPATKQLLSCKILHSRAAAAAAAACVCAGAFGSLHLLPLYPSTGDRGFAPVTYQEVDPQLGRHEGCCCVS